MTLGKNSVKRLKFKDHAVDLLNRLMVANLVKALANVVV